MNKLNGGYIMVNLDDLTTLKTQLETAIAMGKPVIVYKDGKGNPATILKSGSEYDIYLPNNIMYSFSTPYVALYEGKNVKNKYRHISVISWASSGTTHTLTIENINSTSTAYTNFGAVLDATYSSGFNADNKVKIISDTNANVASIYVTKVQGASRLNIKVQGGSTFVLTVGSELTFVSDDVIEI